MKNVHNGRGNINVSGSGAGGELLLLAAAIAGGYFLITVIVHLLIMLAIALGAIVLSTVGGIAIWHFYIEPRIKRIPSRIQQNYTQGAITPDYYTDERRAIENTRIVLTPEQYEILVRKLRDES